MARSGPNGIGGAGKAIGNRKHEGGRYGLRRLERSNPESSQPSTARKNTGMRSAVRYGFITPEAALKAESSDETHRWVRRRIGR